MRHSCVNLAGVVLLALAMAGANSLCLNCCKPDVAQHLVKAGNTHVCPVHATSEEHECTGSHCAKYLSLEGFLPPKGDAGADCILSFFNATTEFAPELPSDRVLTEGQRLWRSPPPPFQCGLVPRLI